MDRDEDIALMCPKKHLVNGMAVRHPEANKEFCPVCGGKTFFKCLHCGTPIVGANFAAAVTDIFYSFTPEDVPDFCSGCGKSHPWKVEMQSLEAHARAISLKEQDRKFSQIAIQQATQTQADEDAPRVGAVIVQDGIAITWAHKSYHLHAEEKAVKQVELKELVGSTVYTTLEPCLSRSDDTSCADILGTANVARVVIGILDPNKDGYGLRRLAKHRIAIDFFPKDVMEEVERLNGRYISASKARSKAQGPSLRERILEHKGEVVYCYHKKGDGGNNAKIVDCDEEVVILEASGSTWTEPLSDLETSKKMMNGRLQFILLFPNR